MFGYAYGYARCSACLAAADRIALYQLRQEELKRTKDQRKEDSRDLLEQISDIWRSFFSNTTEDAELKAPLLDQTKKV